MRLPACQAIHARDFNVHFFLSKMKTLSARSSINQIQVRQEIAIIIFFKDCKPDSVCVCVCVCVCVGKSDPLYAKFVN